MAGLANHTGYVMAGLTVSITVNAARSVRFRSSSHDGRLFHIFSEALVFPVIGRLPNTHYGQQSFFGHKDAENCASN